MTEADKAKKAKKNKKKKTRCALKGCKKKKFAPCRCGKEFCIMHVDSTAHSCTFDYNEFGHNQVAKHNPKVVADKLQHRLS